jgi:NAD-dependent SIR2 family protein deacetylase
VSYEREITRAAHAIAQSHALLIGAGAGMGVDSGLPDFRGKQGFWNAYPPYQKLGLDFVAVANPRWFSEDPALAWGFYGHRLNLYRATEPHAGFQLLLSWATRMPDRAVVFTSNVDGHFQRAGFDSNAVAEVHGSVHFMQCRDRCGADVFPADTFCVAVDENTMRALDPLPTCPACGKLARPNILMFGDWEWDNVRASEQQRRMEAWIRSALNRNLTVIECGAGTAIPTVRSLCEEVAAQTGGTLIRINTREHDVPPGQISLPLGCLEALRAIDEKLQFKASGS